ncbi:baseplate J/gp47 family protein [Rhizobium sp. WYJ-E13]|uniref:baseplate J/gp47 family protein n=1 Tax=Rhizobium sp. WYJ-E13 TaxID=2849093 RepID=UPI001C1ECE34|nr:baseplate J/gp47 family protein [Rhizobium sp. WYJ-E13]QWW71208.1 hypothetical protein KQ933_31135 [Rhizobium sp. WYJ-E13]
MKRFAAPRLENRRTADFQRELDARAATWLPNWNRDENSPDFGLALLKIAARFSSEVAERLDFAGDKMALGFLDWLGMKAEAARPARVPVAFKLADTATAPVTAPHPVKMQADAGDAVTFETETDLRIVPGAIEFVVGVDPANDRFYLPPPGIASLEPIEALPTEWRLKSFAAAGATMLQLDPGFGLSEGMIIAIGDTQYEIRKAQDDLLTIEPPLVADAIENQTVVRKVTTFRPFDGARNRQEHILYIGDSDLLDIEAAGSIEIAGLPPLGDAVTWEYWGKTENPSNPDDVDARWRAIEDPGAGSGGTIRLTKPKGAVEETQVGAAQARWIRARQVMSTEMTSVDGVELKINPLPPGETVPEDIKTVDWTRLLRPDVFVNSASSPPSNFYLLGREPRMFDTLYLGSDEAFSKAGATAWMQFDIADSVFQSMSGTNTGVFGYVIAAIDARGALHLLTRTSSGSLVRLRDPLEPEGLKLTGSVAPVMWVDGLALRIAVAAGDQVLVRVETWPDRSASKWLSLGKPAFDTMATAPVDGLSVVNWNGQATLVALKDARLSTRTANATTPDIWPPKAVEDSHQVPIDIRDVVQVRHATVATVPTRLLAISAGNDVYDIVAAAAPQRLIANIATDVRPCGLEDAGELEVVAVDAAHAGLLAQRVGRLPAAPIASPALDPGISFFQHTTISGRVEDGHLTAYLIARDQNAVGQSLISWQPFINGRDDILYQIPTGAGVGELEGSSVLAEVPLPGQNGFLFLAGSQRGEMYSALLGSRITLSEASNNLRSAVAISPPANLAVAGDTIGFNNANGNFVLSTVEGTSVRGLAGRVNTQFFWINRWRRVDTTPRNIEIYRTSVAIPVDQLTVDAADPSMVTFQAGVAIPSRILVRDNAGELAAVDIAFDTVTQVATATPPFPAAAQGTGVGYWAPVALQATVYPALTLSAANNAMLSTDMFGGGNPQFPDLSPRHQNVIAQETVSTNPTRLAFETAWQNAPQGATFRLVVDQSVTAWSQVLGDSATNPALSWEYSNGTSWLHLQIAPADDGTNSLRNSGTIRFTVPSDLRPSEWAGKTTHWIRARLIGGDYGRENVVVISEPVPNSNQTKQTVQRTTEGIQPPYALDVGIAYAIDTSAPPRFLLTRDSGMLRDQSDANRTPGASIEVFTPLATTLGRLDGLGPAGIQPGSSTPKDEAGCDCPACTAEAGQGAATSDAAAERPVASRAAATAASSVGKRALYVGLRSSLIGAPVNVLFTVDREGGYDAMAPLRVDVLIGNRFTPVLAADDTCALGERGLLKMAFPVVPTEAELFGQPPLTWLRLAPTAVDDTWTPSLSGAHLNAVWARAAETMTRELLGASSGEPNLTVSLARPPVLQNSLQLRVREPLGDEERHAMLDQDPNSVLFDLTDLPGDWVMWKQVADTIDRAPTDRVYALDEATGTIRFGDGQHGMIPPTGADAIVAFSYERADAGTDGVVPANFLVARSELNLVTAVEGVETVRAADSSAGGVATESPQRVLQFAPARLRHRGRAVSASDFESLAQERSDQVVQARCTSRNGRIRLITVMRGDRPVPSRAQQRELRRMLLDIAPPALAAPGALTIEGPGIRMLRVDVTVAIATLDIAAGVSDTATSRIRAFFDTERGGPNGEGWPLGQSPREEDVAVALLDIGGLDNILDISLIELSGDGSENPWPTGIRANELAMLADDGVRVAFKAKEAAL